MLFLLCIVAFLQMAWIPGRLLTALLPVPTDTRLQRIVYTFAFSLLFNYLLVFLLAATGLYRPAAAFLLLAVEALLLLRLWIRPRPRPPQRPLADWLESIRSYVAGHSFLHLLMLGLALLAIGQLAGAMLDRFRVVFVAGDTVLSWNRWALQWAQNQLPTTTSLYPQLLPANWSLSYLITGGGDIQFVPRNLAPLFPMATVLLLVDFGRRRRNAAYFLAGFLFVTVVRFLSPDYLICDGMMDLPVAFFCLLSVHALLTRRPDAAGFSVPTALLALTFAGAAAVTKQSGLLCLAGVLGWVGVAAGRDFRRLPAPGRRRLVAGTLLILAVVVLPWYGSRLWLIHRGVERSMITDVTQTVHHGRSYPQRLQFAFETLFTGHRHTSPQWGWAAPLLLLLAASLGHRLGRRLTLLAVLPYTLVWALFYSYDCRNLTIVFPLASMALALGARRVWELAGRTAAKLPRRPLPGPVWALVWLAVALIFSLTLFRGEPLRRNQLAQQRRQGEIPLNAWLYSFHRRYGFAGKVFSQYRFFQVLPELREYAALQRDDPRVVYYLENYRRPRQDLLREIRLKVRSGEYTVLFAYNEWRFIQIRGEPPFRPKAPDRPAIAP